jgi:O-antigen ligase
MVISRAEIDLVAKSWTSLVNPGRAMFAAAFNPERWFLYADLIAVLIAIMLPWSTTVVGVLGVVWLLALIPLLPTLETKSLLRLLASPACRWPIAIFALAIVGMLWADSPWRDRLQVISPVARLLLIPILFYHFMRSKRGMWVFLAFLASCSLVMILSWIVLLVPDLKFAATANDGVPVKNYIDQSQEFSLCMVGVLPFVVAFWREGRHTAAAVCAVLVLAFFFNMAFVVSARGALLYLPVMLLLFAVLHLDRRTSTLLVVSLAVIATAVWFSSSYLRTRFAAIAVEFREYELNIPASTGRRLEYWQKSVRYFSASPIFGNGTGSIRALFERDAIGKTGLAAEVTRNPHNQTLNVAVQWGLLGVVSLYAMWFSHLMLFRSGGIASWIGLLVVTQNVLSSLLNSHLFDFHEGWMYVLGVGVAGGMKLGEGRSRGSSDPA